MRVYFFLPLLLCAVLLPWLAQCRAAEEAVITVAKRGCRWKITLIPPSVQWSCSGKKRDLDEPSESPKTCDDIKKYPVVQQGGVSAQIVESAFDGSDVNDDRILDKDEYPNFLKALAIIHDCFKQEA